MRRSPPRVRSRPRLLAAAALVALSGCSLVPRSQLDESRRLVQGLQAENVELKDRSLKLAADNEDLERRAVADARRLGQVEDYNGLLKRSVASYQREREQIAGDFDRFRRQVELAVAPIDPGLRDRLVAIADSIPGGRFDAATGRLLLPAAGLFADDDGALTAEGRAFADRLAEALAADPGSSFALTVAAPGRATDDQVRRAGFATDSAPVDRGPAPWAAELAGPLGAEVEASGSTAEGLVEIRLRRRLTAQAGGPAGVDSAGGDDP